MISALPDRFPDRALGSGAPMQLGSRGNGDKLTVFLLPGLSGDVVELASLISASKGPFRFVPIHYRHWSQLQRKPDEFDRLISDCVREIESHRPAATILLLGYSFGGHIAVAVARSMETLGYRIGLLGMIDARARPTIEASADSTIGRMGRVIRGIRRGETTGQLARSTAGVLFRLKADWVRSAFRRIQSFRLLKRVLGPIDLHLQMRYHLVLLTECVARMTVFGERLQCASVLFASSGHPTGEEANLGWTRYLAKLRVVTLTGDHTSVVQKQNVAQIVEGLVTTLSETGRIDPDFADHLYVNTTGSLLSKGHADCTQNDATNRR